MKVLVVEDEILVGQDLVLTLGELGFTGLGPHATVADAIAAIGTVDPDLVLLDIELRDGELSAPVANLLQDRGIPFLCLSGHSSRAYRSEPPFAEAARLEKPVDAEAIRMAVTGMLRETGRDASEGDRQAIGRRTRPGD